MNLSWSQFLLILLEIIWDTIKEFKPPTWIEDESDDDDDDGDDDNPTTTAWTVIRDNIDSVLQIFVYFRYFYFKVVNAALFSSLLLY